MSGDGKIDKIDKIDKIGKKGWDGEAKAGGGPGAAAIPVLAQMAFVQLLYRKSTIAMVLFMLIPVAISLVWVFEEKNSNPLLDFAHIFFVLHLHILLPLISLLFSVSIFNTEIKDHTMAYLFVRPMPRWILFLGKFLGLIFAEFVLLFPSVIATFIVFLSKGGVQNYWDDFGGFILILVLGIIAYSAFFTLIGIKFKHPLLIGIFVAFFWDKTIAAFSTTVAKFTILYYLVSVGHGIIDVDPFANPGASSSMPVTFITLACIVAVLFVLSVMVLNRKQLS